MHVSARFGWRGGGCQVPQLPASSPFANRRLGVSSPPTCLLQAFLVGMAPSGYLLVLHGMVGVKDRPGQRALLPMKRAVKLLAAVQLVLGPELVWS